MEIEIPDEPEGNAHAIVDFSLDMVQLWTDHFDDLWERNKYIASETVLKHRLITVLNYDGINELRTLLAEGLCKKGMNTLINCFRNTNALLET